MYKDFTVRFGVEWYDMDFFLKRKHAYQDHDHAKMYAQFGATTADIRVSHYWTTPDGEVMSAVE